MESFPKIFQLCLSDSRVALFAGCTHLFLLLDIHLHTPGTAQAAVWETGFLPWWQTVIHSHALEDADLACGENMHKIITPGNSNKPSLYCPFSTFISVAVAGNRIKE